MIESITVMNALYFVCGLCGGLCWGVPLGLYLVGVIGTGDPWWPFRRRK